MELIDGHLFLFVNRDDVQKIKRIKIDSNVPVPKNYYLFLIPFIRNEKMENILPTI